MSAALSLATYTGTYIPSDYEPRTRTVTCAVCNGTGEIRVYGQYGEYEQPDPCPRCQRHEPTPGPHDDRPF